MIEKWQSDSGNRWDPYPPLVGFLAVVFREHPNWIERLVPPKLTRGSATAVAGALRLAGDPSVPPEVRSRIAQAGSDEILKRQLAGLPSQLLDLQITLPTHLDILWGAAFASGDDRYVLKIIDFFAKTANQSNQAALDIAKLATTMPGDPKGFGRSLRSKYGDRGVVQLVFAATALWALSSNARQHPFIKETMVRYTNDRFGTPAATVIFLSIPRK